MMRRDAVEPLRVKDSAGDPFLEKVDADELSGSMVTQPSLAESS